jgi:phenylpropionate dioxygenase-like ring-hydroxylating dioxygenase large terminal subunit
MPDAAPFEPKLAPPATKRHLSVARLARWWYVACESRELRDAPLARTVIGVPLVLFRDASGQAAALLDRCPHRNVPLSLGRVVDAGRLECAYHGWQFDGAGACRVVPGLLADGDGAERGTRRAPAFVVREQSGVVWVWPTPDEAPTGAPFALPYAGAPGYATVMRVLEMDATLHAVVENALDVPHTAFLHRGLFRGGVRHEVTAIVRRTADQVEAEYVGEPRPEGFVGRMLAPGGGVVQHWDRFVLPSVAQVEYRLGANHLVVTSLCTPVTDTRTRMFAVVSIKLRALTGLAARLVQPLALRIFRQDARILAAQTDVIRRFGGEQYMSTELDMVGPQVWRLLKHAEAGTLGEVEAGERRVRFEA